MNYVLMIFPLDMSNSTNFCTNCGRTEHEGDTGELHEYVIMERAKTEVNWQRNDATLCKRCADGFTMQMTITTGETGTDKKVCI